MVQLREQNFAERAEQEKFVIKVRTILSQLREKGVDEAARNLHEPSILIIKSHKAFPINGELRSFPFAMHVANFSGRVWACSDGTVIRESDGLTATMIVMAGSAIAGSMKLLPSLTWPSRVWSGFFTPMRRGNLLLVQWDIIRWAIRTKPTNIKDVILPSIQLLVTAFQQMSEAPKVKKKPLEPTKRSEIAHVTRPTTDMRLAPPIYPKVESESVGSILPANAPHFPNKSAPFQQPDKISSSADWKNSIPNPKEASCFMKVDSEPESKDSIPSDTEHTELGQIHTEKEISTDHNKTNSANRYGLPLMESNGSIRVDTNEIEDNGSPSAHATQVEVVEYATVASLTAMIGNDIVAHLPELSAFHFSTQGIEDYLALRLRIGECYDDKTNMLHHLWAYFKVIQGSRNAPSLELITHDPVAANADDEDTDPDPKNLGYITYEALMKKIESETAQLFPLYEVPRAKEEFKAVVKWGFIQAAESPEYKFTEHLMPLNNNFVQKLRAACTSYEGLSFDDYSMMTYIRLGDKKGLLRRQSFTSVLAAAHAEKSGFDDLDKLPAGYLKTVDTPIKLARPTTKKPRDAAFPPDGAKETHRGADSDMDTNKNEPVRTDEVLHPMEEDSMSLDDDDSDNEPSKVPYRVIAPATSPKEKRSLNRHPRRSITQAVTPRSPRRRTTSARMNTVPPIAQRPMTRKLELRSEIAKMKEEKKVLSGRVLESRDAVDYTLQNARKLQVQFSRKMDVLLGLNDKMEAHYEELIRLVSGSEEEDG